MKDVLLSVGIDVGTSTTQVVFSKITLQDMSNGLTVPRVEIVDKEIIYRSDIHFTPLTPLEIAHADMTWSAGGRPLTSSTSDKADRGVARSDAPICDSAERRDSEKIAKRSPSRNGAATSGLAPADIQPSQSTIIDAPALRRLVQMEYTLAGVNPHDVKTGAVVITGETARKQNADEVTRHLSDLAGDFVVATAGPTLESVLAGRGAGADVYSRRHSVVVANYDIGGGTSNFVLFDRGEPISASCMDIGGRLVRVDRTRGVVTYVAEKIGNLCASQNIGLRVGDRADIGTLRRVAQAMCQILEMSLGLVPKSGVYQQMLTEPGRDVVLPKPIGALMFSGGVADCALTPNPDVFAFGDLGVLLGEAIRQSAALRQIKQVPAVETIRATVVGAGTHITKLSGSTIEYDASLLPIKDVPALKLTPNEEATPQAMGDAIRQRLAWFATEGQLSTVAIAFVGPTSPTFKHVQGIAAAITSAMEPVTAKGLPTIIVTERDLAKVLGQSIRAQSAARNGFICIDGISVEGGDYVDIGAPAAGGTVLPVVVKTLVFH